MSIKTWEEISVENQKVFSGIITNEVGSDHIDFAATIYANAVKLAEKTTKTGDGPTCLSCNHEVWTDDNYCHCCGARIIWDEPKKRMKKVNDIVIYLTDHNYVYSPNSENFYYSQGFPKFYSDWFQYCGRGVPVNLIEKMHEDWLE